MGGAFVNGISAFIKELTGPFHQPEHRKKPLAMNDEEGPHQKVTILVL